MQDPQPASQVIQFCEYSINSSCPQTVQTAALVLYNHIVTCKNLKNINTYLFSVLLKIVEKIT